MAVTIALALGGNSGDVRTHFDQALSALSNAGISDIRMSSVHATAPVDCPPGSPDFLNAALTGYCGIPPLELLALCKELERKAGRPAHYQLNSPRPLDIDIILYGNLVYSDDRLTILHPRAVVRRFVLEPLAEIAPELVFPDSGLTVRELAGRLG